MLTGVCYSALAFGPACENSLLTAGWIRLIHRQVGATAQRVASLPPSRRAALTNYQLFPLFVPLELTSYSEDPGRKPKDPLSFARGRNGFSVCSDPTATLKDD